MPLRAALASVTSLFVVLAALPVLLPTPSTGLDVEFPELVPICGQEFYDNSMMIVVTLMSDGQARVNQDGPMPFSAAANLVRSAFRTRAEKWMVIRSEGQLSWGQFVGLLDEFRGDNIRVAWATAAIKSGKRSDPSCKVFGAIPARPGNKSYWRWFHGQ